MSYYSYDNPMQNSHRAPVVHRRVNCQPISMGRGLPPISHPIAAPQPQETAPHLLKQVVGSVVPLAGNWIPGIRGHEEKVIQEMSQGLWDLLQSQDTVTTQPPTQFSGQSGLSARPMRQGFPRMNLHPGYTCPAQQPMGCEYAISAYYPPHMVEKNYSQRNALKTSLMIAGSLLAAGGLCVAVHRNTDTLKKGNFGEITKPLSDGAKNIAHKSIDGVDYIGGMLSQIPTALRAAGMCAKLAKDMGPDGMNSALDAVGPIVENLNSEDIADIIKTLKKAIPSIKKLKPEDIKEIAGAIKGLGSDGQELFKALQQNCDPKTKGWFGISGKARLASAFWKLQDNPQSAILLEKLKPLFSEEKKA